MDRARKTLRETVHSVSLLLHQLPDSVWYGTSYDECRDLIALHNRQHGRQEQADFEELHDFDKEQIAALRAEEQRNTPE